MTINDLVNSTASERPLLKDRDSRGSRQLEPALLKTPFQKLALALSGGGFRAGAFSIGTMSYLYHLKYPSAQDADERVLDHVQFVSSASGGSLAGILYTMHVRQGIPFQETYHKLIEFMTGQVSLEQVLKTLNEDNAWTGEKSRNLINAFSKIYHEKLFEEKTFGIYTGQNNTGRPIEVCFNSTEFYRGISFRFQASPNRSGAGLTGNKYVYFDPHTPEAVDTLSQIRLGDIMAASSCFPAGFEPIILQKDFTYTDYDGIQGLNSTKLRNALVTTNYDNEAIRPSVDVGLMDGGIDDNQGVYSAMLADKRRRNKNVANGFDLVFITDVASYFMDPYEEPSVSDQSGIRKESVSQILNTPLKRFLKSGNRTVSLSLLASLALLIGSVGLLVKFSEVVSRDLSIILTTIFSLTAFVLFLLKWLLLDKPVKWLLNLVLHLPTAGFVQWLKSAIPALRSFSDRTLQELVRYLRDTPTGVLEQMVKARVNSMLCMILDVNLKQTRRLIFDLFYGAFYGQKVWQNRRVFNVIYELSTLNIESRKQSIVGKFAGKFAGMVEDPLALLTDNCGTLNEIAERARTMGTTLWFDEADTDSKRMRDVVVCGQFTTCVQLLEYVLVIEQTLLKQQNDPAFEKQIDLDNEQLNVLSLIKAQLLADWERFKTEPLFLWDVFEAAKSKQTA
jgi:predicted acylesterase/phospholipase RssA